MKNKFFVALALLCAIPLFISGCNKGPKKVHITGSVTVAGETVETGSITFDPVDGQGPSEGGTIVNGKFEADVTTGEKRVKAYGSKVVGQFEADPTLNPGVMTNKYEDFPAKAFQEEITVKIEKKDQVVDVSFSGEGAKK